MLIEEVFHRVQPLDPSLRTKAQTHLSRLTKPQGSLGRIEELLITLKHSPLHTGEGETTPPHQSPPRPAEPDRAAA